MQEKSNEPIWFDKEPVQTIDLTEQLKGHTLPPHHLNIELWWLHLCIVK
jgi:hypothetical protein